MEKISRARVVGPLALYADGFRVELARMGYTVGSAENHMYAMAHLSSWLLDEGLQPDELDVDRVRRFLPVLGAGRRRMPTEGALAPLLGWLRDQQVVPPARASVPTALDGLLDRYRRWLVEDRGLAVRTITAYMATARRFLVECGSAKAEDCGMSGLSGETVTFFLLGEGSRGLSGGSIKNVVIGLRSLLRFAYLQGLTPLALAEAVPAVAGWRDAALPATLSVSEVTALLASCDRDDPMGLRDFAILLLLARLGLRAAEVAGLELGDADWRSGVIVIRRAKSRRQDLLPLPVEVGEALVAYLKGARPRSACRAIFLTRLAPWRQMHPNTVSRTVVAACRRIGRAPVGAHRLRHALATEMLAQGAGLVDIGQVLRHKDLATTAIYAKVDHTRLRQLAQLGRESSNDRPRKPPRRLSPAATLPRLQAGHSGTAPAATGRLPGRHRRRNRHREGSAHMGAAARRRHPHQRLGGPDNRRPGLRPLPGRSRPPTEVPPVGLVTYRRHRRIPHLYSDHEVCALMAQARRSIPSPLRAATVETVIGLLAVTGVRVSEALHLERTDVDWAEGTLTIRETKYMKSRRIPLQPSTMAALADYARRRDELAPRVTGASFFVSSTGNRVDYAHFWRMFRTLCDVAGVGAAGGPTPRIHDLRHSFAVRTLTDWQRSGADVDARLPWLSTYLGHREPRYTYWYITATPELLALAAQRLEAAQEARP